MISNLISISQIAQILEPLKKAGKKIVMTNGCFDILHVGHKRYLEQSKALGDVLVVALNSDKSVKALKGDSRPINNEADRAELLLAFACVDYVIIFEETSADNILKAVSPDLYTKGGDYSTEDLKKWSEYSVAQEIGTEVHIIDLVEGKSSSKIIAKARS